MSQEGANIQIKAISKVEKYAEETSQEDIDNGIAIPIETIETEDTLYVTSEEAKELGLDTTN